MDFVLEKLDNVGHLVQLHCLKQLHYVPQNSQILNISKEVPEALWDACNSAGCVS